MTASRGAACDCFPQFPEAAIKMTTLLANTGIFTQPPKCARPFPHRNDHIPISLSLDAGWTRKNSAITRLFCRFPQRPGKCRCILGESPLPGSTPECLFAPVMCTGFIFVLAVTKFAGFPRTPARRRARLRDVSGYRCIGEFSSAVS